MATLTQHPVSLRDYRLYFGNSRYIKIVAEHFLKGHHRDTLDMSMEYEWLEDQGIDF